MKKQLEEAGASVELK
ncbi:MAG: hypothetical protein CMG14_00125 [Candidatus Marinimicrobia bacterium]|nr:hypothetical protein [Candidatus Neomarinimicrobiota bacterium]